MSLSRNISRVLCRKYATAPPECFSEGDGKPVYEFQKRSEHKNSLYAWGVAEHGALGYYLQKAKKMKSRHDPRFKTDFRPIRLAFAELNNVTDVAAGFGFTAFAVESKNEYKVFGTGINTDSQIGYHDPRRNFPLNLLISPVNTKIPFKKGTKVIGLSAGRAHLVVNTDKEGLFTLGNNAYGQCGREIIDDEKYSGSRVIHNIPNIDNESVKCVVCGQDHTLFLTESGRVFSCGWGADGQTGLGHYNCEGIPGKVLGDIEGENIVKVASRSDCVLAINDKGDVFGWGNSEYSQLFKQGTSVQQICKAIHLDKCKGFGKIIDIAAAGSYCMMLNEEGEVFTWGYGILGRGPEVTQSWNPEIIPPPLFGKNEFQTDTRVSSIYCGLSFSAAINNYGHIYTWGKNKGACLGLRHRYTQTFPLRVILHCIAKKLSLGVDHSMAICKII